MLKSTLLAAALGAQFLPAPIHAQSVSFPVSPMQAVGMRFPGPRLPMVDIRLPAQGLPIQPIFFQASVLPKVSFPRPQGPVFPVPVEKPHWPAAPVKVEPPAPGRNRKPKPPSAEPPSALAESVSFGVLEASWKKTLSSSAGGKAVAIKLQAVFDGSALDPAPEAEPVDARPAAPTQNLPEWELEKDLGVR